MYVPFEEVSDGEEEGGEGEWVYEEVSGFRVVDTTRAWVPEVGPVVARREPDLSIPKPVHTAAAGDGSAPVGRGSMISV